MERANPSFTTMPDSVIITPPDWLKAMQSRPMICPDQTSRMRLAIDLARRNIVEGTGGPFGAIIVEQDSGRVLAMGVNSVVRLHNSALHAEVMALMFAQASVKSFTLRGQDRPACELHTSCDPCAMCLGAALWSGVRRVVCAGDREDAMKIGFNEGPVFAESYRYLENAGIEIVRGFLRNEAQAVFDLYQTRGGMIYNG